MITTTKTSTWTTWMTRRNFTAKTKAAAFERAEGRCQRCLQKIIFGKPQYDHVVPCALGGAADLDNCQVLCAPCHRDKTGTRDVPMIAKAVRTGKKHRGEAKTRNPLPFGRASAFKKKLTGKVVRR